MWVESLWMARGAAITRHVIALGFAHTMANPIHSEPGCARSSRAGHLNVNSSEGNVERSAAAEQPVVAPAPAGPDGHFFGRVSDRISSVAGVQRLEGFSLKDTFSEVFSRHSYEEVERYFSVGGPDTTPALAQIDVGWPKPWVFFRTLLVALGAYIAFV